MAVLVSELITRIKQRTNNEYTSGEFVSESELIQLIRTKHEELYGYLVRYGIHQLEDTQTITANGAATYSLDSDFYSVLGVYRADGDRRLPLKRHDHYTMPVTTSTGDAVSYRIMNGAVQFYPVPTSGTYSVVYIPKAEATDGSAVAATTDSIEGVNGWEEYIVIACSIAVKQKEEMPTEDLKEDLRVILDRIKSEAASLELSESWMVRDVKNGNDTAALNEMQNSDSYRWWRWRW